MLRLPAASIALLAAAASASAALAADPAGSDGEVSAVTVVAATPLPGVKVSVSKLPYAVRTLSMSDLDRGGTADLTSAMQSRLGGVNVNDNLDDAFQPDILYHGFEASPVLGTPQGLAVYQNGVRINEAFGDTVNWDLVPDDAVARLDVVGSNPVYGLNALGGAVVVTMKTGFDAAGGEATLSGGGFGQRELDLTYGAHSDRLAIFAAARGVDADGWRLNSSDRIRQVYADAGYRGDRLTLDLSYSGADNTLHGESATPVQELAVSRKLIFTSPQLNGDQLNFVTVNGGYSVSRTLSLQAAAYVRDFRQSVANGNTTNYTACASAAGSGLLCQPDGLTPLATVTGGPIPDLSSGGTTPIGENDLASLQTLGYGGSLQASSTAPVFGLANHFAAGIQADAAQIRYRTSAEVGVIDSTLAVLPSGYLVATPEGGPFTATPVDLRADNIALGGFVTDTLDVTHALSVTASARYNWVRIALKDRLGSSLSGVNDYARLNPSIGLTYAITPELNVYGGYAEGARAPTASEIECSSPTAPCLLPSSLSADPPNLKQVVSQSYEAGVRGSHGLGPGRLSYSLGLYQTTVRHDIYAVATSLSAGYFQNIAGTRRQGVEISFNYRDDRVSAYLSYSYVQATFGADFLLPSPSSPFQDADGNIQVRKGDRLPGIPASRLKLGADARIWGPLRIGADLQVLSGQRYRGDESNQLAEIPGYAVLGLHASYPFSRRLTGFVRIENALGQKYSTFGVLGDPTGIGAPGVPADGVTNGPGVDNRFLSPAPPFAAYGGLKVSF